MIQNEIKVGVRRKKNVRSLIYGIRRCFVKESKTKTLNNKSSLYDAINLLKSGPRDWRKLEGSTIFHVVGELWNCRRWSSFTADSDDFSNNVSKSRLLYCLCRFSREEIFSFRATKESQNSPTNGLLVYECMLMAHWTRSRATASFK